MAGEEALYAHSERSARIALRLGRLVPASGRMSGGHMQHARVCVHHRCVWLSGFVSHGVHKNEGTRWVPAGGFAL
jgi:hypothetical protein